MVNHRNVTPIVFAQPKIFNDLEQLYQLYWQTHCHLPKSFRFTTGEAILMELTHSMRNAVQSNITDRDNIKQRNQAAEYLAAIRSSLEVVRGLLCLGWKMKMISHGAIATFYHNIDEIQKQATAWQQWFKQ